MVSFRASRPTVSGTYEPGRNDVGIRSGGLGPDPYAARVVRRFGVMSAARVRCRIVVEIVLGLHRTGDCGRTDMAQNGFYTRDFFVERLNTPFLRFVRGESAHPAERTV